jgi:peptidoglycan/xylan/chitin deacetylase (PgdA/CDA1 family)
MDDVNWPLIPAAYVDQACGRILDALRQHGQLKAALFAVGKNVDNEQGRAILDAWNRDGHMLGNHTWSHKPYDSVEVAWFEDDMLRDEALLKGRPNFRKFFRFPALKEGKTAETRDAMRSFLAEHGYRNGHVTIDASDWYYDARLRQRLTA